MKLSCLPQLLVSFVLSAAYFCCRATATATCYLPNAQTAYGDIPCSDSLPSICCPADGICLSNGLCFSPSNIVARSSCTDQSWNAGVCTSVCKTRKHLPYLHLCSATNKRAVNTGEYCPLTPCGGDQFCCGEAQPADDCCSAGRGFLVGKGTPSLSTQTVTSTFTQAAVGGGGVFTLTTTITSTLSANGACPTTTACAAVTGTDSQPNNAGPSASCPNCSTREAAIGAGVGIPLSAALLGSLILLFLRRKRDKHPSSNHQPTISQPAMVQPYKAPQPEPVSSEYASGGSQYEQYPNSPGGYAGYAQVRPHQDPVDPIPIRVVSPDSDGGRYELGDQIGRSQPPRYVKTGKH